MTYKVVITYDSEYEGYVVDVPELNGCMSEGKTLDEALSNVKDAIKGWLYVESKHGRAGIAHIQDILVGEVTI
ncbi:MAG: type II toxin-antitoxin system HicB family antitoxin [Bacteroidetes bacterium]|nr:type II toxin-antitoxin system HicB family antitoxin [Bacteroidota bacterium]MCL5738455.1 type II toxin-antitoxin system HicB family antitoxin [Bacteroidota bacterium]